MTPQALARFWKFVVPALDDSGCLLWSSTIAGQGYAWLHYEGRPHPAHKLAYEHYVEAVPEGMTLDHLCRNRSCVNWAHLEAVTRGENVLRGTGFAAKNKQKTHCPMGHAYDDDNTYISKQGWRSCRTCTFERNRARRLLAGATA